MLQREEAQTKTFLTMDFVSIRFSQSSASVLAGLHIVTRGVA